MKRWWVCLPESTLEVEVHEGIVINASPRFWPFVGQHFSKLITWARHKYIRVDFKEQ